jgi:CHAT domain-containing protein
MNARAMRCALVPLALLLAVAAAALPEAAAQTGVTGPVAPRTDEVALRAALQAAEAAPGAQDEALRQALDALAAHLENGNRLKDALAMRERQAALDARALGAVSAPHAKSLSHVAALRRELGDLKGALADNERVLALYRQLDDARNIAIALNELGYTYRLLGEFPRARALYEESIARLTPLGTAVDAHLALTHHNLGALLRLMNQPEAALVSLQRAAQIEERLHGPDHPNMAIRHSVTGLTYADLGDYARAVELLRKALAISEKALGPEHRVVATRLNNLAGTLLSLGQPAEALALAQRGLAIDEKVYGPVHQNVAMRLNTVSLALRELGRHDESLVFAERALEVGRQALGPEHNEVAVWINNLAQVHRLRKRLDLAVPLFEQALAITEKTLGPRHLRVAGGLNGLAAAQWELGRHDDALASLTRAIGIVAGNERPETQWRVQAALRRVHEGRGDQALSIFWGKQAVNTVQSMRIRLAGMAPDVQRSFLADKRALYVALADQLVAAGRLAEAQEVLAMLKEEELHDFTARSGDDARGTRASYVGPAETAAEQRWREIAGQLAQLGRESAELTRKARTGLSPDEQARRRQVDADLVIANQQFDRFVAELRRDFASAGARRAEELGGRQLQNLVVLQDLLAELGRDAVLLHYVVAEQRVAIILTTADVQIARESRITAADLNRKVLAFRQALAQRRDVRPQARELHALLVAPVAADLRQAGARTLMLSLDGTLRYLPFAALHDGRRWLVEDYALSLYTEAARTQLTRRPQREWAMTGLGLTRAVPGFAALPAVREELEGVRRSLARGELFLDEQFTAERVRDTLAAAPPVMHIASHFQFRPGTFANSFLLLGDGSRLTLQDVRDRRLRFSSIELLTLSACDTAMGGGTDETGAEVEGFGALAQQQGASAVLATLWPVADASTGRFMQLVYGRRAADRRISKADALRQAQLAFVRGRTASGERLDARLAQPFFWAPYVLMGNWL